MGTLDQSPRATNPNLEQQCAVTRAATRPRMLRGRRIRAGTSAPSTAPARAMALRLAGGERHTSISTIVEPADRRAKGVQVAIRSRRAQVSHSPYRRSRQCQRKPRPAAKSRKRDAATARGAPAPAPARHVGASAGRRRIRTAAGQVASAPAHGRAQGSLARDRRPRQRSRIPAPPARQRKPLSSMIGIETPQLNPHGRAGGKCAGKDRPTGPRTCSEIDQAHRSPPGPSHRRTGPGRPLPSAAARWRRRPSVTGRTPRRPSPKPKNADKADHGGAASVDAARRA